jgi:hypothetical protein
MTTLRKWTLPANYLGAEWPDYYVFLGRNRDSDCLTNSNFDWALKTVQAVASKESVPGDPDESATVQVVSENHWAVGWVEWIAIHESDKAALAEAERICERLENYPVLDEEDFYRRETEQADRIWADCYNSKERVEYIRNHRSQFEFRSFSDLIGCIRGHYFAGYANELIG